MKLSISSAISNAIRAIKGAKTQLWLAIGVLYLCVIPLKVLSHFYPFFLLALTVHSLILLFGVGLRFVAINRMQNKSFSYQDIFSPFKITNLTRLTGLFFVVVGIVLPGIIFVMFPAYLQAAAAIPANHIPPFPLWFLTPFYLLGLMYLIYFAIRLGLASAFIVDKKLGIIAAVRASFKATKGYFFRLLGINFINLLVLVISFPLMLSMLNPHSVALFIVCAMLNIIAVWTIPYCLLCYGEIYKQLSASS